MDKQNIHKTATQSERQTKKHTNQLTKQTDRQFLKTKLDSIEGSNKIHTLKSLFCLFHQSQNHNESKQRSSDKNKTNQKQQQQANPLKQRATKSRLCANKGPFPRLLTTNYDLSYRSHTPTDPYHIYIVSIPDYVNPVWIIKTYIFFSLSLPLPSFLSY